MTQRNDGLAALVPLAKATLAARRYDPTLGTAVSAGMFTIVSVTYDDGGVGAVERLDGPMSLEDAVAWMEGFAAEGAVWGAKS